MSYGTFCKAHAQQLAWETRRAVGRINAMHKRTHGKGEEPTVRGAKQAANYPTCSWWQGLSRTEFSHLADYEYAERMSKGSGINYTPTATGYDA